MKKDEFGKDISKIEAIIGYTFHDKSLLRQAFTRTSWCNERGGSGDSRYQSNEVLEFFGDSVLSAVIVSFLLAARTERYVHGVRTALTEGDFSSIKSKLSDKTNLSLSTKRLGLEKFLLLGEGDVKLGIANEPSVMEDLFESIVGAVYIDSGKSMDVVTRVVSGMLDMSVYEKDGVTVQSAKNALQEWCADKSRRLPAPVYKTLSESGPDHKKVYSRGVFIGERLVGRAEGKNQKIADALAAHAALELLIGEDGAKNATAARPRAEKTKETNKKPTPSTTKNVNKSSNKAVQSSTKKPASSKPTPSKSTSSKPETAKGKAIHKAPVPSYTRSTVIADLGDLAYLKKHAKEKGCPPPLFHDLGIVRLHNGDVEYRIECELAGKRATGSAATRTAAREAAIAVMRELIEKRAKTAKGGTRVKNNNAKKQ